jgi:hypothetical protein
MNKLFENIDGNRFKLISESVSNDEPKSSLVRKGLKKVFSEGEKEYSYKKLEGVGLGYIRDISEAKTCALREARELALEFGYKDDENNAKFVKEDDDLDNNDKNPEFQEKDKDQFRKDRSNSPEGKEVRKSLGMDEDETDMGDPAEKREVQISRKIFDLSSRHKGDADFAQIRLWAQELLDIHSPNGPIVKPGTGGKALYKRGSVY